MRTSKRSNGSSAKRKAVDRPFDPAVLSHARSMVGDYRLVLEPDEELGYIGSSIELPTVFADAKTPDACVKATREALTVAVATMLELGKRAPSGRRQRTQQVNIRLTPDERLALEEAAARQGFKGVSDFVRTAALGRIASATG